MRIQKVMHNPTTGETSIDYTSIEHDGQDQVSHKLKSKDYPHPDMVRDLGKLIPHIEGIAELPKKFLDAVRGFTVHRNDDENPDAYTVTFAATKRLKESNSPLVINTPAIAPDDALRELVESVIGHAVAFVDGKRAQDGLFPENGETDAPAAKKKGGPRRKKSASRKKAVTA